jgi:mTERF
VLDALRAAGLTVSDCQAAVRKRPGVLRLDADKCVAPVLSYLEDELGMGPKQVRAVVTTSPQVFVHYDGKGGRKAFDERLAFLRHTAHVPSNAIAAAVAKRPGLLWMDMVAPATVIGMVAAACPLISAEQLGSIFGRVPQALLSNPTDIARSLDYLTSIVHNPAAVARVIGKLPLSLVFAQATMNKRLDYLRSIGLPDDVSAKVITANPEILNWSIEHALSPAVKAIAAIVGDDANAVATVISKLPAILGSVDTLQSRVDWLTSVVGLTEDEVSSVIRVAPAILTYSVAANLTPKWSFISNTMGGSAQDIVSAPIELLCASLQQRHMPRYAYAMSHSKAGSSISVVDMLKGSDAEYCRNVIKCDPTEYRTYVEQDLYLLFFSQLI